MFNIQPTIYQTRFRIPIRVQTCDVDLEYITRLWISLMFVLLFSLGQLTVRIISSLVF